MNIEEQKIEGQDLKSALGNLKDAVKAAKNGRSELSPAIADYVMSEILAIQEQLMELFADYGSTLTGADRTRLIGAGIKNIGFIQVAYGSASANTLLVPAYLDMAKFGEAIADMDRKRTLLSLVQQFAQNIADGLLVESDTAYHYALEYYNYVKEAARQRVPGAETEYNRLKPYFKKTKTSKEGAEPTDAQIERDLRSLLHGTKEGRIVVENEKPDVSAGKRTVVDDVRSDRSAIRETSEIKEKE